MTKMKLKEQTLPLGPVVDARIYYSEKHNLNGGVRRTVRVIPWTRMARTDT